MEEELTENLILQRLAEGWDLANRGTGWFLSEPPIPYRRTLSIKAPDSLVGDMICRGVVIEELPHNTIYARLPEAKPLI